MGNQARPRSLVTSELFWRRPVANLSAGTTWRTWREWNFSSPGKSAYSENLFISLLVYKVKAKYNPNWFIQKGDLLAHETENFRGKAVFRYVFVYSCTGGEQDLISPFFHPDLLASKCWNHSETQFLLVLLKWLPSFYPLSFKFICCIFLCVDVFLKAIQIIEIIYSRLRHYQYNCF